MRLDSVFYNGMVNQIFMCMDDTFGSDIKRKEIIYRFENMGFFKLVYVYFPLNYNIVIENEIRTFDIEIYDAEQASNSLYRITKFKNQLNIECIKEAISILKTVLERNDFNLYFHKDGKLYKKNTNGIKRVRDIRELLDG